MEKPETKELRNYWNDVNEKLEKHFNNFSIEEWFQRHTAISEADFEKEPHRNRLNVLLNRTSAPRQSFRSIDFFEEVNHLENFIGYRLIRKVI